ncbi:alpha-amylase [Chamaesiphon minutus]|uniref:Glycosidase n=1 Tax=Chamaesiphon minutus (strain ATCC 27169 / PCC 6605) TaxID=1173020 RepID=K9UJD1_CHAP6|nr:alpha-amylase [Chamaesiphon minutus]AFY95212.1 glycosidase [Chamaesiphon minutus PCC 6605]
MSAINGVMMQYFHWYLPPDGSLWQQLGRDATELVAAGFTALWLPPAYKGSNGGFDVGYATYDLFDLGEFDQKGSIRTKYGTKAEYLAAIDRAQTAGIQIYGDVVFNHRLGADAVEEFDATPLDHNNRYLAIDAAQKIQGWTHFTFPGRQGKYSTMEWHWWHFDAIDYNVYNQQQKAVYLIKDKAFDRYVDLEKGNFDYLMGCDLDMDHPEVVGELKYWGQWYLDTTKLDGFRLDAVKHIEPRFFYDWIAHLNNYAQKDLFTVGEYWSYDLDALEYFINQTQGKIHLFDAPLHNNFFVASRQGRNYDLRRIFDETLVRSHPTLAVTFVENHDSQPLQSLESVVEGWFKPLAYALILLREAGYPCVFYSDYYGSSYRDRGRDGNEYDIVLASHRPILDRLLHARREYAYGIQLDYFDHPNTVGWTRLGNPEHPASMAVLLGNGKPGSKWMNVGKPNTTYIDMTESVAIKIRTNADGWGEFVCNGGSVSVWIPASI